MEECNPLLSALFGLPKEANIILLKSIPLKQWGFIFGGDNANNDQAT